MTPTLEICCMQFIYFILFCVENSYKSLSFSFQFRTNLPLSTRTGFQNPRNPCFERAQGYQPLTSS